VLTSQTDHTGPDNLLLGDYGRVVKKFSVKIGYVDTPVRCRLDKALTRKGGKFPPPSMSSQHDVDALFIPLPSLNAQCKGHCANCISSSNNKESNKTKLSLAVCMSTLAAHHMFNPSGAVLNDRPTPVLNHYFPANI
jgi:hypothetical protein